MNILVIEPYNAGSHRAWAEGFADHSRHRVRLITHPGRWWKWRMRGSALTLARSLESLNGWSPDLVLVSDMIDLAHFRVFARPLIGDPPAALYFHESQLTYPTPVGAPNDLSYGMTNWLSAYAADRVFFNSGYHRDVFFESLPRLLGRVPDMPHDHLIHEVAARSEVLPVGVDLSWIEAPADSHDPPRILWNHRWEHDTDPDAFADSVEMLIAHGVEFELTLLGGRPPNPPSALNRIRQVATERIFYDGEAPTELYRKLVQDSDVIVSTSKQEFFGVSVVEAIAAGCNPVLPRRLSYPWLIPTAFHDSALYDEGDLTEALMAALADPTSPPGLREAMARFSWERMAPTYDDRFEGLVRELSDPG